MTQDLYASLAEAAERLHTAASGLDAQLKAHQERILALKLWVESSVPVRPAGATDPKATRRLSYAKHDGVWGLWIERVEAGHPLPLLQAPKEDRVNALRCIPHLIEKLTEQARATARSIEAGLREAQSTRPKAAHRRNGNGLS